MPDLKDALDLLETGARVSIAYVGFDEHRGTAGDIIRIDACRLVKRTTPESAPSGSGSTGRKRKPNHYDHGTRNVRMPNGRTRKFHIYLLFAINGKKLSLT